MEEAQTSSGPPWILTTADGGLGYFEIRPNYEFPDESRPLKYFVEQINKRARSLDLSTSANESPKKQRLRKLRQDLLENLRELAEDALSNLDRSENKYLIRLGRCLGRYDEQVHDLDSPEYIVLLPDDNDPTDLTLGDNARQIEPEQQAVLVDVYRAKTVVNIVFERREKAGQASAKGSSVKALYLKELRDIGLVAAETPAGVEHAKRRLEAFRESFVTREAEVVKTQHLRQLGKICLGFVLVSFAVLLFLALRLEAYEIADSDAAVNGWHTAFIILIMSSSSCVGTWLSFSLRKVSITYGDLAGLEEDRLDPAGRVIFVMLLTAILGLVVYSGLLTISVSNMSLRFVGEGAAEPHNQVVFAILIGAFAGIAERSLSGMVAKQAEDVLGAPGKSPD